MLVGVVLAVKTEMIYCGVICVTCNESDNLLCCKELQFVSYADEFGGGRNVMKSFSSVSFIICN